MKQYHSTSLLASFATIKALSDENKYQSAYQILAEFIRHVIVEEHLYSFTAAVMKNRLNEHYGFIIPEAVVKSAVKKMAGIISNNGEYRVSFSEIGTDSRFKEKKKEADDTNKSIFDSLVEYVKERTETSVNTDILTQDLIALLMDDQRNEQGKYTDYIGEFILKNETNMDVQDGLNRIREGSILYIGLNYNISETGSITKPLTLFLDTEILFSLNGLNGELYKELAQDFFGLVQRANANGKRMVTLRYFSDVKREIDDFYYSAREIVNGTKPLQLLKPAMSAIINGCTTVADVDVKQADFYHILQYSYGIMEDPNKEYYGEDSFSANLESFDYLDDGDDNSKKREMGIKHISHINKLRNGARFTNDIESGFLLVTNTRNTLHISKEEAESIKAKEDLDSLANFAVSLDRITSLLWYKLGNGFGNKDYPKNVSAVLRSRLILSSSIAKKLSVLFPTQKNNTKLVKSLMNNWQLGLLP